MSQAVQMSGKCLCKKVTINAQKVIPHVDACHCAMCRKWSGSSLLAMDCGSEVVFEGQQYITAYDSSEWADRGFCKNCGTHLFYRLKQTHQYIIPAGLFDTDVSLEFTTQIFIEEKPDYYEFANQTQMMTGEEVFAAFGGSE
tara:strand:+ start:18181 stop:18606 length:426 start_codon:yes stop_codon:yes gene_type:complete